MSHKKLQDLKAAANKFEEVHGSSVEKANLNGPACDVFEKCKSSLDITINSKLKSMFPEAIETTYFPYRKETREELVREFENKMKFVGISQKFPEIINFIFDKTRPPWVKKFINIRNKKIHEDPEPEILLNIDFQEITDLARKAYLLAAEFFNFIDEKVKEKAKSKGVTIQDGASIPDGDGGGGESGSGSGGMGGMEGGDGSGKGGTGAGGGGAEGSGNEEGERQAAKSKQGSLGRKNEVGSTVDDVTNTLDNLDISESNNSKNSKKQANTMKKSPSPAHPGSMVTLTDDEKQKQRKEAKERKTAIKEAAKEKKNS